MNESMDSYDFGTMKENENNRGIGEVAEKWSIEAVVLAVVVALICTCKT